jgi:hypothetical protein
MPTRQLHHSDTVHRTMMHHNGQEQTEGEETEGEEADSKVEGAEAAPEVARVLRCVHDSMGETDT